MKLRNQNQDQNLMIMINNLINKNRSKIIYQNNKNNNNKESKTQNKIMIDKVRINKKIKINKHHLSKQLRKQELLCNKLKNTYKKNKLRKQLLNKELQLMMDTNSHALKFIRKLQQNLTKERLKIYKKQYKNNKNK